MISVSTSETISGNFYGSDNETAVWPDGGNNRSQNSTDDESDQRTDNDQATITETQNGTMDSNSVLDLYFLNEFGLDDLADQLQQELGDTSRANPFAGPSKPKPLTLGRTGGDVGTS